MCRDVDSTSVGMSVAGDGAHMWRSAGDHGLVRAAGNAEGHVVRAARDL